jgi:hypothetical protein
MPLYPPMPVLDTSDRCKTPIVADRPCLLRTNAGPYQIHPFSRAIRYASARDPASSFWVIVAR